MQSSSVVYSVQLPDVAWNTVHCDFMIELVCDVCDSIGGNLDLPYIINLIISLGFFGGFDWSGSSSGFCHHTHPSQPCGGFHLSKPSETYNAHAQVTIPTLTICSRLWCFLSTDHHGISNSSISDRSFSSKTFTTSIHTSQDFP